MLSPRVALLCCGLGNVNRGHEVFAKDLFALLRDRVDITLFKGGGSPAERELVIDNIPRDAPYLTGMHLPVSPKWERAAKEGECLRIEAETFAYNALKPLLMGDFDVVHCLEREVCRLMYANRHLFKRTPKILFSNGGGIPKWDLPPCDFVQEHTEHNYSFSAKDKAFVIPHGVDLSRFRPDVKSSFRKEHGIPDDAFVVIAVGSICYQHKRTDYVIKEVAALPDAYLLAVGQEGPDSAEIKELGNALLGDRVRFLTLPHDELPLAYAAADVFTLGSLFETFGIAYIEAMAMGLPVICTNHPNQRFIVQEGVFVDMAKPGALTQALRIDRSELRGIGLRGRALVEQVYDLRKLRDRYFERYSSIAQIHSPLPACSWMTRLNSSVRNLLRSMRSLYYGRAE